MMVYLSLIVKTNANHFFKEIKYFEFLNINTTFEIKSTFCDIKVPNLTDTTIPKSWKSLLIKGNFFSITLLFFKTRGVYLGEFKVD